MFFLKKVVFWIFTLSIFCRCVPPENKFTCLTYLHVIIHCGQKFMFFLWCSATANYYTHEIFLIYSILCQRKSHQKSSVEVLHHWNVERITWLRLLQASTPIQQAPVYFISLLYHCTYFNVSSSEIPYTQRNLNSLLWSFQVHTEAQATGGCVIHCFHCPPMSRGEWLLKCVDMWKYTSYVREQSVKLSWNR